jgi:hypothetical protein
MECDADHVDPFSLQVLSLQQVDFASLQFKSERCVAPEVYGNFCDLSEEHVVYT